jgi:hypothetical protein
MLFKSIAILVCGVFLGYVFATFPNNPTPSTTFDGFDITDRGILPFGVPFVRSGAEYGRNRPTALDVGPRGKPPDQPKSGMAWLDVCNADLITTSNAPVSCGYLGAWQGHIEFGSRSFNGAPVRDLKLRVGDKVVGELTQDGLVIYGGITAEKFVDSNGPDEASAADK